jgi:hypothetical protein
MELEVEPATELQSAGVAGGGDISECSATDGCVGSIGGSSVELRVIQQIEGLEAQLDGGLAVDVEGAEQACIEGRDSGTAELISVRVAKVRRNDRRRLFSEHRDGYQHVGGKYPLRIATPASRSLILRRDSKRNGGETGILRTLHNMSM